jgi:hypothetical protein
MQRLTYKGELVGEYPTRALAIVACFELNLVYDQHARKLRNTLLPGVKIDGTDELGYVGSRALEGSLPRHPLDRKPLQLSSKTHVAENTWSRPRPSRGPLDDRKR